MTQNGSGTSLSVWVKTNEYGTYLISDIKYRASVGEKPALEHSHSSPPIIIIIRTVFSWILNHIPKDAPIV